MTVFPSLTKQSNEAKWIVFDLEKKKILIGVGFYDDPSREFREIHTQNFLWLWQMVFRKKPNSPIIWCIWPHVNSRTSYSPPPSGIFWPGMQAESVQKSLFLEILDTAGKGVNGNNLFGVEIQFSKDMFYFIPRGAGWCEMISSSDTWFGKSRELSSSPSLPLTSHVTLEKSPTRYRFQPPHLEQDNIKPSLSPWLLLALKSFHFSS